MIRVFLKATAELYGAALRLRQNAYARGFARRRSLAGKVISIGNIEVGGTGKTPITIAIAKRLQELGHSPAILTRGYRSGLRANDSLALCGEKTILPARIPGNYCPDEARLQADILRNVPVIVGAKRYQAAMRFLKYFPAPSHWLLDDGFQHLALQRDLDVVLIDAKLSSAQAQLMPLGRLREPISALERADVILLTRGTLDDLPLGLQSPLQSLGKPLFNVPFLLSQPRRATGGDYAPSNLTRWLAIAAIARPDRFLSDLAIQGIQPVKTLFFRDHSKIPSGEKKPRAYDAIITTAKDWARDAAHLQSYGAPVFIADIAPSFSPGELEAVINFVG